MLLIVCKDMVYFDEEQVFVLKAVFFWGQLLLLVLGFLIFLGEGVSQGGTVHIEVFFHRLDCAESCYNPIPCVAIFVRDCLMSSSVGGLGTRKSTVSV